MIHTHTSPLGFSSPLPHERRLCRIEPQEALRAPQQIRENPALYAALRLYDDPFLLNEYAELRNSNDRANFRALLLANIVRTGTPVNTALTNHNRATFLPVDPSRIFPEGTINPTDVQLREAGQRLKLILTDAQLRQLDPPNGRGADDAHLGRAYFDARARALDRWNPRASAPAGENLHDRPFQRNDAPFQAMIRTPIELYRSSRRALDRILNDHEILFPGIESADSPGTRLSRREYAGLLALVWNGGTGQEQIRKAAATAGNLEQKMKALQALIRGDAGALRVQEAFDLIVHEEHGPTELLRTLDITLGPGITIAYVNRRRGAQPRILQPGRPGPNTVRSPALERNVPEEQVFQTMDSAATWRGRANAGRSISFLTQNLPDTPKNQEFLRSLRFHFGTAAERAGIVAAPLNEEATLLRLHLIIDTLVLHEEVTTHSTAQTERLRERVGLSQRANEFVGSMVDIVRDWRNNPVPAALVVAGGFLALRQAYRFLTGEHRGITRWMTYIGLGAVAYGLYQERQQGSAWWDSYAEQIGDWWRGQEALPPERRTLPNLWARETQVDLQREQVDEQTAIRCMSILQNQTVPKVCGFYEEMRLWETNGGRAENQPPIPQVFEIGRYGQMFGQRSNQEIGRAMYKTLKAFFKNRGRALGAQGFQYAGQQTGEEQRGFEYIRDRYHGRRFFSRLVEGGLRQVEGTNVEPNLIAEWDTDRTRAILRQLRRPVSEGGNPTARRFILVLRAAYVEEQRTAREQVTPWTWQTVLLFEADPGALERMGREGAQPASFLRRLERWYNDVLHQYSPLEPGPEDRADVDNELLRRDGAERRLLANVRSDLETGSSALFNARASVPRVILDRIFPHVEQEWAEFLDRIPMVTEAARKHLNGVMREHIRTWTGSVADLMNDIEQKRYQLLAAASQDTNGILSDGITRNVTPATFDSAEWLRWFVPGEARRFPEINSLADVRRLLGINVTDGSSFTVRFFRSRESLFPELSEQIDGFQRELTELQQLPDLLLPASGADGVARVAAIDRMIARRFGNRLLELSLYTLRRDSPQILDTPQNRFVTASEQSSLQQYFDDVYRTQVPREVSDRLQQFNKQANAVENVWPQGNLRVIVSNDQVSIVMNTGAALPGRFLTEAQRKGLTNEQKRFEQTVSADDIITGVAADLVRAWKEHARDELRTAVRLAHTASEPYPAAFVLNIVGDTIEYRPNPPGASATAVTPMSVLFTKSASEIRSRYRQWERPNNVPRPSTDRGDPFQ